MSGNPANKWLVGAIGATLLAAVSLWEGTEYKPYEDVVGVLTVCQGYTGKDIIRGKTYSKAECDAYLAKELGTASKAVLECTKVPLNQSQYNAYVMFTYNVGTGGFCGSKSVLGNLNKGNYKAACNGLLDWKYAKGKVVQGLYNRRVYERKMCLGELDGKA